MDQAHSPETFRIPSPEESRLPQKSAARKDAPTGAQIRARIRQNVIMLCMFTIVYLVPIGLASSMRMRLLAIGIFLAVLIVGSAIALTGTPSRRIPTSRAEKFVGLTAFGESIAAIVGLIVGFVTGNWWPFGVLLLGSVALHFISLAVAFFRRADYIAIACIFISLTMAIVNPLETLWDSWAIAGALAAGSTAMYVIVIGRSLRHSSSSS